MKTQVLQEIERQLYIKNGLQFINMYTNNTSFRTALKQQYNDQQITKIMTKIITEIMGEPQ